MSDETTINMFWQGPPVPPLVWACMRSFVHHGHRVRVFSYSSLVVPAGVTLEDAHDVHPSRNVLDNHPAIAQHADIFRYHLLYKYGGWWVDTDVLFDG
jgi:mannosyltransferase OCH1-like enzyme